MEDPRNPEPGTKSLSAQLAVLHSIFRPSAPTEDRKMFKGRTLELSGVINAVQQVGQHVIVYGERGVGKTSLAYMARDAFREASSDVSLAIRVACNTADNFDTLWNKITDSLRSEVDQATDDEVAARLGAIVDKYEDIIQLSPTVTPDCVARALKVVAARVPLVVILDEFDRFGSWTDTVKFAELIKLLSDDLVKCTVFIVGIADDVTGLIEGHASIDRALRQVHMPLMTRRELAEVVTDGFEQFAERCGIRIAVPRDAVLSIARMSMGFPYYTHLLAGSLGEFALKEQRYELNRLDVTAALLRATNEAAHSIRVAYTDAVTSAKPAQFDLTLLACAMVRGDELGFFAPKDIREPLSYLAEKPRKTSDFHGHLKRFAEAPIWILDTRGDGRTTRYRFRDPLMKPFVLMQGIYKGQLGLPDDEQSDDKQ